MRCGIVAMVTRSVAADQGIRPTIAHVPTGIVHRIPQTKGHFEIVPQKLDSWIRMRLRAMKFKRKSGHDNSKLRAGYFGRRPGLLTLEGFCTYRDRHGEARR